MLSDKFLDEMWRKCSWMKFNGPNEPIYSCSTTIDSDQLRDLLVENRELRTRNANLEMDMVSHTEIVEMWNDKCDEVKNLTAKVRYWENKYCVRYESPLWPETELQDLRATKEFHLHLISGLAQELAELKQKLLELGGCPNANS